MDETVSTTCTSDAGVSFAFAEPEYTGTAARASQDLESQTEPEPTSKQAAPTPDPASKAPETPDSPVTRTKKVKSAGFLGATSIDKQWHLPQGTAWQLWHEGMLRGIVRPGRQHPRFLLADVIAVLGPRPGTDDPVLPSAYPPPDGKPRAQGGFYVQNANDCWDWLVANATSAEEAEHIMHLRRLARA